MFSLSNRPSFYGLKADKPCGMLAEQKVIRICNFKHPKWFISLQTIEPCGLLLLHVYDNSEDRQFNSMAIRVRIYLINNNQINACPLIGQLAMVYCAISS